MPVKIVKSPTIDKSVQFNGTNQYLTVGSIGNFNFLHNGLSNWTVEGWVNFNTLPGTAAKNWISDGANTSTELGMSIVFGNGISNGLRIFISRGASGGPASIVGYSTAENVFTNTNTWYHVAVTFNTSSKLLSAYINGTAIAFNLIGTYQNSVGFAYSNSNSAYVMAIGRGQFTTPFGYFDGYMSNTRVLNGTVLYTSSFSVPTTRLTAITNTSLLTCNAATIVDGSSNNFTVSSFGSPTVSDVVPYNVPRNGFKLSSSNTRSEFKKSVQFNGSGQYLTATRTGGWLNSANNFTLECWVYFTRNPSTYGGYYGSHIAGTTAGSSGWELGFSSDGVSTTSLGISFKDRGGVGVTRTFNTNTWYHVAIVRSGTTVSMYIDGTFGSSGTIASWPDNNTLHIGALNYSPYFYYFPGYISNFRIVDGTAVYTSNFTPSTTALTAITNTLLLICQDSVTKDNSSNNFTVNAVASPTLSALNPFTVDRIYSKMGWSGVYMIATGGDLVTTSGSYKIHKFTTVGTSSFTISSIGIAPSIEYLIVGGGGGGGYVAGAYDSRGGGGGAGGFRTGSISSGFAVGSYSIIVGSGGSLNNNGQDSSFLTVISLGGGGGGFGSTAAKTGGSGGGGGAIGSGGNFAGAVGTAGQGNSGGGGGTDSSTYRYGGGGGGAGSVGVTAINSSTACVGGSGSYSNITGTNTPYAGGGGGGQHAGGIGGGGAGTTTGSANTGGGGGGGFTTYQYANYPGGTGGSGIVIIKYRYAD